MHVQVLVKGRDPERENFVPNMSKKEKKKKIGTKKIKKL